MKAILVAIGDEILIGQIIDTNSNYIVKKLSNIGVEVIEIRIISDKENKIIEALETSSKKADIVITTGGLGPTKDDVTKLALSKFLDSPLVYNEEVFENIKAIFKKVGRIPNEVNKNQALHPKITEILKNDVGTAPCMWSEKNETTFINLPGVPYEMKFLMEKHIIPRIKEKYELPFIFHRNILTMGVPESELSLLLNDFEEEISNNVSLAYLPSGGRVNLRLTVKEKNKYIANNLINKEVDKLTSILGKKVIDINGGSIEELILKLLEKNNLTISFSESCTGGNLAKRITNISGSSKSFKGSLVSYSTESKENILNVNTKTIKENSVVSKAVVEEMALNTQKLFNTSVSCSTSGVAGPNKGEDNKNIGTFCYAISINNTIISEETVSPNKDREQFTIWATNKVLQKLYLALSNYTSNTR